MNHFRRRLARFPSGNRRDWHWRRTPQAALLGCMEEICFDELSTGSGEAGPGTLMKRRPWLDFSKDLLPASEPAPRPK
jgi:hypothetical protein